MHSFIFFFVSINAGNKDVASLPSATSCTQAIRSAEAALGRQQWAVAKEHLSHAIQYAENAPQLLLRRAECSHRMGEMYEAIADTGKLLKLEADSIPALELRGNSYYSLGELESAMNHYKQGLKFDPEHSGCKNGYRQLKKIQGLETKADAAMSAGTYDVAVKHLTALVDVDPSHRTICPKAYQNLATALKHLKKFKDAKAAALKAIEFDDGNAQAHQVLGQVHMEADEFEEAAQQFRRCIELEQGNHAYEDDLRRAEAALKQSKQKDYYKILGVGRKATVKEIKKAYREQALLWHPDKHTGEEEKEKAAKQFQLVAEAYEVLENPENRQKYDRGEDVFPNQGGGGQPQHHNPFAHFQHGGGRQFHFQFG